MKKLNLFLMAVVAVFTFTSCGEVPLSEKYDGVNACIASQDFVRDRLKAPSSAKFDHDYINDAEKLNDTTFMVRSHFESQNSFGAMLRGSYKCKITFFDTEGTIKCEDLYIY